jgi:dTDP-4-dehydrorhamnose 3,5-epimerase
MQRIETSLPGVWELRPRVIRDSRGFFMETYKHKTFCELGILDTFVQDNHSFSPKDTLRGLHYQLRHPQAKICRVVEGKSLDVVVDIRRGSPNFGKWTSLILSAEKANQIYIPAGFAHGFLTLSNRVQFLYKCSDYYSSADEFGILWNDPQLSITWGISDPLVSEKDRNLPSLSAIPSEYLPPCVTG